MVMIPPETILMQERETMDRAAAHRRSNDEVERLRAGIQAFLDGDYEPRVKKLDKCPHGAYGYETCEACIEVHFIKLLGNQ